MSAYNLLSELRQAGVVVKASGNDRLVVDAPKGALTPEMRTALADHKKELLAILTVTDEQPAPAPAEPSRSNVAVAPPLAVADSRSTLQSEAAVTPEPTDNIEDKIRRLEKEAAQLRAQQEARRAEIEARQRRESEIKRLEEEAVQVAVAEVSRSSEFEALRRAEEEKWQLEVAAQKKTAEEAELRQAEEERRAAQLEARRHAEEEIARRRSEEEIRKVEEQLASLRAGEVNRRAEVTARWQAEDERWRAELENRRTADELSAHQFAEAERQRVENENKYKAQDEEARHNAELKVTVIKEQIAVLRAEQESFSAAEALRKTEEEASRKAAAEALRRSEQEAQLHAAEVVRQKAEEEARRRSLEDARRADEAARAAEQEARLRAMEAERQQLEEQARREAEVSAQQAEPEWFHVNIDEGDQKSASATPLTLPETETRASAESEGTFIDYQEFESSMQVHPTANLPAGKSATKDFHVFGGNQADAAEDVPASSVSGTTLSMLASESVSDRCAAVTALPQLGGEDAFAHISGAFDDPAIEVRNAAARAMFSFQTDRAASFTRALREGTPERRRKIGAALASSGLATEAIGNLTGESREKTYDAFSLLFLMSKAGEVQPLLRAIEEHANVEVRLAVVKLLALSGQHEILPAFRRLAVRGSLPPEVRSSVMEAIYQISSQTTADAHSAA
ncbi:MAG: TubC N-terminal docking domain [Blastocatellia bacterium]|jgi:hypothetical protein|nr:TubC N-terminal docking domain [Blastocatellia bacterium]